MKIILSTGFVHIPEGVHHRNVTVTGPRGSLHREFKHLPVDMSLTNDKRVRVDMWFGLHKNIACVRTACSHIKNMITGVVQGFRYKMRLVYAHFPINASINKEGNICEVRNFLGEKRVRVINMLEGVKIYKSDDVKDELVLEGNSIENVSTSAFQIYQSCLVRNKDIRKFLDGIYVSERGVIPIEDDE
ncbi:hypothetical protein WA158_001189 [Blastocystis sp. Blastoise]